MHNGFVNKVIGNILFLRLLFSQLHFDFRLILLEFI